MRVHAFYILLLLIACGVIFYMFHKLDKADQQIYSLGSINKEQAAKLSRHVNSEGRTVVEKPLAIADIETLKKYYPKLVADIEKKAGIKSKNLVGALQAQISALGSGIVEIRRDTVMIDSGLKEEATGGHIEIDDNYLRLRGDIHKDVVDYIDYNYSYNDTLTLAVSSKKHFFKGEELTITGVLQNPNAQIVKTAGIVTHRVKTKRFNVSVGVYYDPLKNTYGPALTAGYALVRF